MRIPRKTLIMFVLEIFFIVSPLPGLSEEEGGC